MGILGTMPGATMPGTVFTGTTGFVPLAAPLAGLLFFVAIVYSLSKSALKCCFTGLANNQRRNSTPHALRIAESFSASHHMKLIKASGSC
jgi:hypothetical protein